MTGQATGPRARGRLAALVEYGANRSDLADSRLSGITWMSMPPIGLCFMPVHVSTFH